MATTLGTLGLASRKYVHRIPFIVKLNHNAFLHMPDTYDQIMFSSVRQASDLGAIGRGRHHLLRLRRHGPRAPAGGAAFAEAHRLGMFTVLWCYLRNAAFKKDGVNYEVSADLTGQANHMGVTIEADIIKQKQPENNGGYTAIGFGKTDPLVYDELTTDNPIDLTRWQVVNCTPADRPHQLGRRVQARATWPRPCAPPSSTSGPAARVSSSGRKAFQRPMAEGAALIHSIQDVYLDQSVTIA